ncbi:protein YIF1A-like isoform X1 [Cylas formicarius]|uniref:protein YIF1A-like isoform X1 n=1 Tax=Cylas formicarius TaxID=197179 RepID=UPI0029585992|nr:protein YIF1A-like isoform X1 [Cylas formicarius]
MFQNGGVEQQVSNADVMDYASPNPNVQQNMYPNVTADTSANLNPHLKASERTASSTNGAQTSSVSQFPFQSIAGNLGIVGQPVMQDVTMQCVQQLATNGKTIIRQQIRNYVPFIKLKCYFAVDTNYVVAKLMLLFFPFTHSDWSVKYEPDGPIQPRFEINAADLYIPTMAYLTYVWVAGMVLGIQGRFTPEQLEITASFALRCWVLELAIHLCILYIMQINTRLETFDLLAYSGYKFTGTTVSVLAGALAGKTVYYIALSYTSLALAFFLIRNLKVPVLSRYRSHQDYQYNPGHATDDKRKKYFLLFVAGIQPLLSWWLSRYLIDFRGN